MMKVVLIICHMNIPCFQYADPDPNFRVSTPAECKARALELFQEIRAALPDGRGRLMIACKPVTPGQQTHLSSR